MDRHEDGDTGDKAGWNAPAGTSEFKAVAREVLQLGTRCVEAARDWFNDRREEMKDRTSDNQRDYGSQGGQERSSGWRSESGREDNRRFGQEGQRWQGRGQSGGQGGYGYQEDQADQGYGGQRQDSGNFNFRSQDSGLGGSTGTYGDYDDDFARSRYERAFGGQDWGGRQDPGWRNQESGFGPGQRNWGATTGSQYREERDWQRGEGMTQQRQGRDPQSNVFGSEGYGGRSGYGQGSRGREWMAGSQPGSQSGDARQGGQGYRGKGPRNFTRSDERITEDLNEKLSDDDQLDATEISVAVRQGVVTLSGTVEQRWMKHHAEDLAERCSGVKDVENNIKVRRAGAGFETAGEKASEASSAMDTGSASSNGGRGTSRTASGSGSKPGETGSTGL